jgi:hypothetical protein
MVVFIKSGVIEAVHSDNTNGRKVPVSDLHRRGVEQPETILSGHFR